MINQIQLWQLFVDIGLITSVLTLTTRAFKASRLPGMLPRTRELESSLRGLINEAEAAGVHLNDQLLRREQNIQKALAEIQQSEVRIAQAVTDAEGLLAKLQVTRSETVRVISDLKHGFERGIQSELARYEERPAPVVSAQPQAPLSQRVPPPSQESRSQASHSPGNESNFVEQTYPPSGLHRSVEVSTTPSRQQAKESAARVEAQSGATSAKTSDLKRIYQSAELLIKEGHGVESVASQMKLPVEGVKLLAQMIEIEREEDSRKQDPNGKFATTDSRLGALASIRRQTSIL